MSHTRLRWAFLLDSWEERKNVDKQDWSVAKGKPYMLSPDLGMSTKPPCRLAHHWMGLSLGDNLLSIRDRDNKMRVGRRAVNYYLSVRRPWLHTVSSSFPLLSIFLFYMVHTEVNLLFHVSLCLMLLPLMVFTVDTEPFSSSMQPFGGAISPFTTSRQLSEWSPF